MKIKVLAMAFGLISGLGGAYAQTGVENGTPFGKGEDSVRCITNISLFGTYAKTGNFKDALPFWEIAYNECPGAHKNIFLYGVQIVEWQIANEKDPAKKDALIDRLMGVYDKRIQYFGDDARYGIDWILGNKSQDYIKHKGENMDPKLLRDWLIVALDKFSNKTETKAVANFMYASFQLMKKDANYKEQYVQDYLRATTILDAQVEAAKTAENEKELNAVMTYKASVDETFANSGAADCETLQNMYADKVEQNKGDLEYLKQTLSLLKRMRCNEIDVYLAASRYVYQKEPSAESAVGLGKQAVRDKDYDTAIKYFEEAAGMETEDDSKADDYYTIAVLLFEQKKYSDSRRYANKALEQKADYGHAYLLIGNMYAMTASSVYPGDGILAKAVFNAVIDKFERARQVDSSVTEEANKLISTYRAHLPSSEDIFMHPDIEKGKPFTVGGWINERTTIR